MLLLLIYYNLVRLIHKETIRPTLRPGGRWFENVPLALEYKVSTTVVHHGRYGQIESVTSAWNYPI